MKPDALATLRCPTCRSALTFGGAWASGTAPIQCGGCGAGWPVRFGIIDLRSEVVSDPYLTREEDLRAAERLASHAERGGFETALAAYYETNARVSPAQAKRFIAGTLAAEDRARAVHATWQEWCGVAQGGDSGIGLDAGCGTGPLLAAAQAPNVQWLGIDVGMRWLVLAAARLRDRGASAVLVCAGATALPLADSSIDVVASESLLENALPAPAVIAESARVLRPGGWLRLTTANRWSIGPDPHIGLPLGGWLPERAVAVWAARRGMVPPRRRLLGAGDLQRLVGPPAFEDFRLGPPPIAEAQRQGAPAFLRAAVDAYRVTARSRLGRRVLIAIGPSLIAVARRTDSR